MNYRDEAKQSLHRAKQELSSGEDTRLKYVALELRMTLEFLVYDMSRSYVDELSETDFEKNGKPSSYCRL